MTPTNWTPFLLPKAMASIGARTSNGIDPDIRKHFCRMMEDGVYELFQAAHLSQGRLGLLEHAAVK